MISATAFSNSGNLMISTAALDNNINLIIKL